MTTPPAPPVAYFRTLPGRLFLLSSALLVLLFATSRLTDLPLFFDILRRVVRLAWLIAIVWLGIKAIARNRRRFLWRVRQKLILSYVFLGFVPVLLIVALALLAGFILYINVAGYMFHESFSDISRDVVQVAEVTAGELGRAPASDADLLARRYESWSSRYPGLSLAIVTLPATGSPDPAPGGSPQAAAAAPPVTAGPWRHAPAPVAAPAWLASSAAGFRGVVAVTAPESAGDWLLVMRAALPTRTHRQFVIVDLPVDPSIAAEIEARAKTRMGQLTVSRECGGNPDATADASTGRVVAPFSQTVAFLDCTNWRTGEPGGVAIALDAPFRRLYSQMVGLQAPQARNTAEAFLIGLVVLSVLFLIIQGSALVMGALLARSITYAVHELFTGTERVQGGDFSHRIQIESRDQLGDLAMQFNRMSSSIEHLLHVQRQKQRLDDELRIAREIQKSLLPASPPTLTGMTIADLCEPAREVGGDYYDFFDLGPRRLGVMVADVSGKGTSAALYMAELKGLMLSLSGREQSPRRLLIEANRLLAAHLDNRSFITMTYAIMDLDAGTMTCARAGHTPLIVVSGGRAEVIAPSGMVLGLRLPGAAAMFEEVLEEHSRPIAPGDAIVLYTDGITEAMNEAGDLFGDEGLASVLVAQHDLDAAGIRERVVREVRAFVGLAEPHDDMTMIVLKLDGPAGS